MHPEADAFLDAIFDNPEDDTPRLVYADWLQEHGQDDYAQFIRLSARAERSSTPPAERKRLVSERKSFWRRIGAVRYDAMVGVGIHNYARGILQHLVTDGDSLVRKIDLWWPAMTPHSLTVHGARGYGPQSLESKVVTLIAEHLPWLRELRLGSPHRWAFRSEFTVDYPFDGSLFATLARPGVLPRLRSLHVTVTRVDAPALRAFAESELASRLDNLEVDLGFAAGGDRRILATAKPESGYIRRAIEMFLEREV